MKEFFKKTWPFWVFATLLVCGASVTPLYVGRFVGDGSGITNYPTGGATNGILQLNGNGTNTTLLNPGFNGTISGSAILSTSQGGTAASTGRGAGANIGVYQMSGNGGGNDWHDMETIINAFQGQMGITMGGGGGAPVDGLFFSKAATGTGTNVWGVAVGFPGNIRYIGTPYWLDLPLSGNMNSSGFYFGMGTNTGSWSNAWPNGTNGSTVQPYLNVIQGNSYTDGGGINIRSMMTNSSHGQANGYFTYDQKGNLIQTYLPQFGWQFLEISDAASAPPYGSALGNYAYQGPGHVQLTSDLSIPYYWCVNYQRTGDTLIGQVPIFILDPKQVNLANTNIFCGVPLNTANVWDLRQNPLWTLAWNMNTGTVMATNGPVYMADLYGGASGLTIHGAALRNDDGSLIYISGGLNVLDDINDDASFHRDVTAGRNLIATSHVSAAQYIGNESNLGGATAIDWSKNTDYYTNLSANVTFTFANNVDTETLIVVVTNDATHVPTFPATVKWQGGSQPAATASKADFYTFHQTGGVVYGTVVTNF